jgi:two-component sensor histidine kinase
LDTSIPLGLIINELLTNAYKYAFKNTADGKINIRMKQTPDRKFRLNFEDNGPGLPENISFSKPGTLGLQMINMLSKQLGGSTSYQYKNGSAFIIEFMKMSDRKKQVQ